MSRILILFICLPVHLLFSQNLIVDSSFEAYKKEYVKFSNPKQLTNWFMPTKGTTDLYSKYCRMHKFHVPNHKGGYQKPRTGESYIGFVTYSRGNNYREYISTEISEPLIANKMYCLEMYVSLKESKKYASNGIGAALTKDKIKQSNTYIFEQEPTIESVGNRIVSNHKEWVRIKSWFIAKGDESYLTLGNFKNDEDTEVIIHDDSPQNTGINAYYYIDDVALYEISDTNVCSDYMLNRIVEIEEDEISIEFYGEEIKEDAPIELKNVQFEVGKSNLLPSSFEELNILANLLKENVDIKIEISGHTDNTGIEKENQKLSEDRANHVATYLIKNGVNDQNITFKGYGSSLPIADNDTESGKASNRRVEFKLINNSN